MCIVAMPVVGIKRRVCKSRGATHEKKVTCVASAVYVGAALLPLTKSDRRCKRRV